MSLFDFEKLWENPCKIHGHIGSRRIAPGDTVRQGMESGRVLRGVIDTVEYMRDPPDQFFATVRWHGHEENGSG